jgi:hypothetical protein
MANADCGKTPAMNQQTTTTACHYGDAGPQPLLVSRWL